MRDATRIGSLLTEIQILGVIAVVGFVAFLIWELTEPNPIVDLRIFRHRGFTAAASTYSFGYGAFFASVVLLPLWLQSNMGYTATWAGYATGIMGILAVASAPLVGKAVERGIDVRLIISLGVVLLGAIMVWRMLSFTPDITFLQMALPTLLTGTTMVMFFIPVTGLAMASVKPEEQANAAGTLQLHAHACRCLRDLPRPDRAGRMQRARTRPSSPA